MFYIYTNAEGIDLIFSIPDKKLLNILMLNNFRRRDKIRLVPSGMPTAICFNILPDDKILKSHIIEKKDKGSLFFK